MGLETIPYFVRLLDWSYERNLLPKLQLLGLDCLLTIHVQSLRAPRQVIDAAKRGDLEDIDAGGNVVDVGGQCGQDLHVLPEAERPDDGESMASDHKEDEGSQVYDGYDQVLNRLVVGEVEEAKIYPAHV